MSIVQEWEGRQKVYILTCDVCGEQLSPQYTFIEAVKMRKAAGWKRVKYDTEYVDLCEECKEEEQ